MAAIYTALRPVLGETKASRRRFATFYDSWLSAEREAGTTLPPANFIHAVWSTAQVLKDSATPADPADTMDAICLALAALEDNDTAYACGVAAIAAGLFDPETLSNRHESARKELAKAFLSAFGDGGSRAVRQASSTREVQIDEKAFWTDLGHILPAVTVARRRLCRIEVSLENSDLRRNGTGFLIGPSKVLTNLHVVDGVAETLPEEKSRRRRIKLHFDYSETTGRKLKVESTYYVTENWCLAKGGMGDDSHKGPSEDYWWDDEGKRDDWFSLVRDTLDYAVIDLDGTPGLQRGWYRLDADPIDRPAGFWALHHPGQQDQTITEGKVLIELDTDEARIFHGASTATGSSGGLLLNQNGTPVGLHYLGIEADGPPQQPTHKNERVNVAIPLPLVARELEVKGLIAKLEEVNGIRPYRGCLDGARPVFGRQDFLDDLHAFWKGDKRILRVTVSNDEVLTRRPGKSFSAEMVEGLFRGPEHHHIIFSAADLKVDAFRVTEDALRTFAEDLVPKIPKTLDTTTPAHVRRLVSFFGQAIRDRLPNHNVWITIDDLDRFDLSDASGREFLATLYNQIKSMPTLRILLIGLPEEIEISGMAIEDFESSEITGVELENLGELLTNWLKERGARDTNITDESFALIEGMLTSYAGEAAPLARLGEFVAEHLSDAADAAFGSAKAKGNGP